MSRTSRTSRTGRKRLARRVSGASRVGPARPPAGRAESEPRRVTVVRPVLAGFQRAYVTHVPHHRRSYE